MKKTTTKHNKFVTVLSTVCILISIGIFSYPAISNISNQFSNMNRNVAYTDDVKTMSEQEKKEMIDKAREYNKSLGEPLEFGSAFDYKRTEDYTSIFNFNDGQICSVEIPKINVNLPVFHGTDDRMLQSGAIHLPNTSFPIGEIGTHSVISAHTAFPGKVFFDRLTELEVGDFFYIKLLDDVFKYEVTEVNIVEPTDTSKLQVDHNKELVTLSTCYPYAVNSHRLLVRGERVKESKDIAEEEINSVGFEFDFTSLFFVPIPIALLLLILILSKRRRKKGETNNDS